MDGNKMERGFDKIEQVFGPSKSISVRQTRRGWFQECLGCEAADEFKWFETTDGRNQQFATSLEDSECLPRMCCGGCHEFTMVAKEEGTGAEILTMHRPWACNAGACKCCCYQTMTYSYQGQKIGQMEEIFWVCVPRMQIKDAVGNPIYKIHPPTCCSGMCQNCFTEGNPCCGSGCCKVPFHIFPADQQNTDDGAPYIGKVVKVPKSLMVELFTDAEAYDVTFPDNATATQKAMIAGSAVLINANFFENETQNESPAEAGGAGAIGGILNAFLSN